MDKEIIAQVLNYYLSLSTIFVGIIAVVWICVLVYKNKTQRNFVGLSFISNYALPLGFFISLGGAVLTLYYSDYLGILPCGLCWFQRVFLYSQVFLFGLAWHKNDTKIFGYTLLLSIVGFVVAVYHSYLQMGYSELLPCPAIASTIDCAKPTFVEFGFVTFPFMAVVLFAILILISITAKVAAVSR